MEWINVFGNNVVELGVRVAVIIVLFRLISKWIKNFKQIDAMAYLIKAIMYILLAGCMIIVYPPNVIDIFDGFTLIFAIIEVADNLIMFIINFLSLKFAKSFTKSSKLFYDKENEEQFLKLNSELWKLKYGITAGEITETTRKRIVEINEIYQDLDFKKIELVIELFENNEPNYGKCIRDILKHKKISQILAAEYRSKQSTYNRGIYINCIDCDELKLLISKALHCEAVYETNMRKLENFNDSLQYMSEVKLVECDRMTGMKYKMWKKLKGIEL